MDNRYQYLIQRIYEDEPITVGPFTGYYFTGWHRVTRYDTVEGGLTRFFLPPGANLDVGEAGFEVTQIKHAQRDEPAVETEEHRVTTGQVLYGSDLRIGLSKVRQILRQAELLRSADGAGDRG